jgi:hypothetical protein
MHTRTEPTKSQSDVKPASVTVVYVGRPAVARSDLAWALIRCRKP